MSLRTIPIGRSIDRVARVGCVATAIGIVGVAVVAWSNGHFLSPVRIVLYGALPVALAAALVFAAWTEAGKWRWLIIAHLVAAALAALAAEVYLRMETARRDSMAVQERPSHSLSERVPQVCASHIPAGGLATHDGKPIMPVSGLANRTIYTQYGTHPSDRFGFKNPDGVWDEAQRSIVFVGDSFTYGADVAPEVGFVERLRRRGYPVINLGCGGNGPLAELASLVEYGHLADPATIVWVYYEGNDLTKDLPSELQIPLLAGYLDLSHFQGLARRNEVVQSKLEAFIERQRESATQAGDPARILGDQIDWWTLPMLTHLRSALGLTYGYRSGILSAYVEILDRVAKTASDHGTRTLLVYLPALGRYESWLSAADAQGFGAEVIRVARRAGFEIIDMSAVFREAVADPRSLYEGHLTPEGYALVADAVEDMVDRDTQ